MNNLFKLCGKLSSGKSKGDSVYNCCILTRLFASQAVLNNCSCSMLLFFGPAPRTGFNFELNIFDSSVADAEVKSSKTRSCAETRLVVFLMFGVSSASKCFCLFCFHSEFFTRLPLIKLKVL